MQTLLFRTICAIATLFVVADSSWALSSRKCNKNVPKTIRYRTKYAECGNNAAIFLSGRFENAFSVVVKKVDHGDRLGNNCPDASCSPFKAQKTIRKPGVRIACLGAAGTSPVFRGYDPDLGYSPSFVVNWISIKIRNSGLIRDVEIYCLPKPYPITNLN